MASGAAPLADVVRLVAAEMVAEVCSLYALRSGDALELIATFGLRPDAVGRTRLRIGEGIVGISAATGKVQNLADAQNHPDFVYRPETGEEKFASLLAVPVRRGGHIMGVLAVQNRSPRRYGPDEVDVVETVAMLLAEALAAAGAAAASEDALSVTLPRQFDAVSLAPGLAIGLVVSVGLSAGPRNFLAKDPVAEQGRLDRALVAMRRDLDRLIEHGMPTGEESREVMEATRLVAADDGWVKRVGEAIRSGLTAEAAVVRVASDLRDRMRRITDPYLRERLADIEDLAQRLLQALDGGGGPGTVAPGTILAVRRLGPAQLLQWHAAGFAGVAIEEASTAGHAAILARALGLPAVGGVRDLVNAAQAGDEAILDADEGQLILRPALELRDNYLRALDARAARRAGYGQLRREPSVTADGTPFSLMLNVGLARRGRRPPRAVPHLGSGRRQITARRATAGGREPGNGVALAAGGAGPAGPAAAASPRDAAGRGRPAALHHVPHGRHGRRVPRRPRHAVRGGGPRPPRAGMVASGHDGGGSGAAMAAPHLAQGLPVPVDRVERPDAIPVRRRPG